MMDALLTAVHMVFNLTSLFMLFVGVLFGVIIGALPGMGSILAMTVCLPFVVVMDTAPAFALILGTYCGAIYGGSIAAILINVPGTPQAAATQLEGWPMSQKGLAGEALGWTTAASVIGSLIACVILILACEPLARFSTKHGGPLEISLLICMGLACIATLSEGNQLKGLMMGVFGLFLSTIGLDPVSSEMRFTFGTRSLSSGIDILPFVVGMFPLSEVFFRIYELCTKPDELKIACNRIVFPSLVEWKSRILGLVNASLIGTAVGILPGTGASPAAFITYTVAKETSKNSANFGKGEPDGLLAPEAAKSATCGGALVPALALGIPGDAETSLILAALTIHQLTPGVRLMNEHPETVYSIFLFLILASLLLVVCGMITVRLFAKLLKIPNAVLLGMIMLFSMIGAFITRNNYFDLSAALIIGIAAFGFRLGKFPLAPCLIGYLLGPQLEYRFSQVVVYRGDTPWPVYMWDHPIAMGLLAIVLFLLIRPLVKSFHIWMRTLRGGEEYHNTTL